MRATGLRRLPFDDASGVGAYRFRRRRAMPVPSAAKPVRAVTAQGAASSAPPVSGKGAGAASAGPPLSNTLRPAFSLSSRTNRSSSTLTVPPTPSLLRNSWSSESSPQKANVDGPTGSKVRLPSSNVFGAIHSYKSQQGSVACCKTAASTPGHWVPAGSQSFSSMADDATLRDWLLSSCPSATSFLVR